MTLVGIAPAYAAVIAIPAGSVSLAADPPRVVTTYAAPPVYLLPAAASIPIPSPGAYYLLPSKQAA